MKKKMSNLVMGIDLGTTYTCVGVFNQNKIEILENEHGQKCIPSCVTFCNQEIVVGKKPQAKKTSNQITISNTKRLIGKTFSEIEEECDTLDYDVIDKDGYPMIEITWGEKRVLQSPHEIASIILKKVKALVEEKYQQSVENCAISVPARFNQSERDATMTAAKLAGLHVLKLTSEPVAAAKTYGDQYIQDKDHRRILVYDFGGGTLDVAVISVSKQCYQVEGTNGNKHLGGEDIDALLLSYVLQDVKKKFPTTPNTVRLRETLREKCERVKWDLSFENKSELVYENILPNQDYSLPITRAFFDELCTSFFQAAMTPVYAILEDHSFSKDSIDDVVLVGGTTKIPFIQNMLKDFFQKPVHKSMNLECVAYGTTLEAVNLLGLKDKKDLTIEVTPLSLGIETAGTFRTCIIPRNTTIPHKKTCFFTTDKDDQESVTIKVLEGERFFSKDNHVLGTFKLNKIPKAPRGKLKIAVTYCIDQNSKLDICANVVGYHTEKKLSIQRVDSYFTDKQNIEKMLEDAKQFETSEKVLATNRKGTTDYLDWLYEMFHTVKEKKIASLIELYREEIDWVRANYTLDTYEMDVRRSAFEKKAKEFYVSKKVISS